MQSAQFELHADIEQRHWWFVARRRILRQLIESVLPPSRENTILDVGCGTGANLASLANDYRCVGIDTSAQAVALAQQRFPKVRFLTGFAPQDVPAEILAATRLVLLTDVLEHVEDEYALLSQLLAAVQPGTKFLITVPADPALWSPHDESFGHYRRYRAGRFSSRLGRLAGELAAGELFQFPALSTGQIGPLVESRARQISRRGGHGLFIAAGAGEPNAIQRLRRRRPTHAARGVWPVRPRLSARREPGGALGTRPGRIDPRRKPATAVADLFDPMTGRFVQPVVAER